MNESYNGRLIQTQGQIQGNVLNRRFLTKKQCIILLNFNLNQFSRNNVSKMQPDR